jgi:hypothetical protein
MNVDDFAVLELSRYELRLRARQAVSLPSFLGSTLRGAFGHALKEAVCVMSHRRCEGCLVASRCIYPYVFETPVPPDVPQLRGQKQAPHPFILTPPMLKIPGKIPERENRSAAAMAPGPDRMQRLTDGRAVRLVRSPVAVESDGRHQLVANSELTFELLLMGRAVEYLPYIIYAVSEMAQRGLGVERARFGLASVAVIDESGARKTIYSGETQRISVPDSATQSLSELICARVDEMSSSDPEAIKLSFLTPTRIRVEGDLQIGMSFELLARNLLRRVSMLAAVHGRARLELDYRGLIARAAEVETYKSSLRWSDWERYSNRQQTKMNMGGFTGEVEYRGEAIKEFLPLIAAGELLHIGAGTGFGLGKYRMTTENSKVAATLPQ